MRIRYSGSKIARRSPMLVRLILPVVVALTIFSVGGVRYWYTTSLRPVDDASQQTVRFVVERGASVGDIAESLKEDGLINSATAFNWYVRGDQDNISLQAGIYRLSPSMTIQTIVDTISTGRVDASLITLLPGRRIDETRQEMIDQGFEASDVDQAYARSYDHPLLEALPISSSLEGYLFPDSYEVNDSTRAEQVVSVQLDTLYAKIEERDLQPKLRAQGLDLHQAIILASIVEREAAGEDDKAQIAQVFIKRLNEGVALGADATFFYAAEVLGVDPSVDLDSPYNTRINRGLPPGPIANFTISSLEAVASPAEGDYLYFVSGDDGNTYFSKTLSEHEALTAKHCIELCKLP